MNELEETMRERLKKNQFMSYNHIELEHVEPDYAVFRLDIRPESRNIFGMVHGGALYTMADNAAGSAAHTDGRNYVTQNGSRTSSATRRRERSGPPDGSGTGAGPQF
ncbi:MAG: PaaI family thioesterase [Oscillospiraceae bacterium]